MKSAAERIRETAEDAARYTGGLLPANALATYMHIGADVTLHELSMKVIDRFGCNRSVSVGRVIALIAETQRGLDDAKKAQEAQEAQKTT